MTDFELTGEAIGDTGKNKAKAKAKAKAKKPEAKDKNHAFYSFNQPIIHIDIKSRTHLKRINFIFLFRKFYFSFCPLKPPTSCFYRPTPVVSRSNRTFGSCMGRADSIRTPGS